MREVRVNVSNPTIRQPWAHPINNFINSAQTARLPPSVHIPEMRISRHPIPEKHTGGFPFPE